MRIMKTPLTSPLALTLTIPFLLLPTALSQTITHITQLSIFTDLPPCISTAVDHAFESVRTSDCPQTNPTSAASCICLKSGGPGKMSKSITRLLPIWCVGLGFAGPEYVETVATGVSLFSEYCTGALGPAAAVVIATPTATETETGTGTTGSQTGAGVVTSISSSATPKQTSSTSSTPSSTSSNSSNTSNNSPSTSSSSSSSGLSLGEKLAIGISIPATLAAMLGCYFAYRQHKTSRQEVEIRKNALRMSQFTSGQQPNR